jgi:twitching motility two-component system response regulator PilH
MDSLVLFDFKGNCGHRGRIMTQGGRSAMSKIVVVDDVYAELQLIEGILKSANHTVVTYMNADKLEEKLAAEKPDLILMDVIMPGRNGFQACRDLKNDERFKTIPIVLVTSKGQESDKFWGQQQGATAYVVKPFKPEDLLAAVKKVLG